MIQIEFFLLFSLFPNCDSSLFFVPVVEASVLSVPFASGVSVVNAEHLISLLNLNSGMDETIHILQKDLLR